MKGLKYTMVFIIPLLFGWGLNRGEIFSFGPLLFAFGVIPVLELLFQPSERNLSEIEKEMVREDKLYDIMLYLVSPIVYLCVFGFLLALSSGTYSTLEKVGLTLSLGVVLGGLGINVAHELGHRSKKFEQFLAKSLLLPAAYLHFFIEHNRGHHKNVSTLEDPASSRLNESVYAFWVRSVIKSYISAWSIEAKSLKRQNLSVFSLRNEMVQFTLVTMAFWALLIIFFDAEVVFWYTAAAMIGFLLLETVNYIEHYGLMRYKVSDYRYEKVSPVHSWNSNHIIGRLMLFELSRHSDHHYQPAKKYQLLDHHDQSPQMPTGYPGMMLLSLIPPLWFWVMNEKVKKHRNTGLTAGTI